MLRNCQTSFQPDFVNPKYDILKRQESVHALREKSIFRNVFCVKSARIWNFSGPYFPAFGLNKERYGVSLCI